MVDALICISYILYNGNHHTCTISYHTVLFYCDCIVLEGCCIYSITTMPCLGSETSKLHRLWNLKLSFGYHGSWSMAQD